MLLSCFSSCPARASTSDLSAAITSMSSFSVLNRSRPFGGKPFACSTPAFFFCASPRRIQASRAWLSCSMTPRRVWISSASFFAAEILSSRIALLRCRSAYRPAWPRSWSSFVSTSRQRFCICLISCVLPRSVSRLLSSLSSLSRVCGTDAAPKPAPADSNRPRTASCERTSSPCKSSRPMANTRSNVCRSIPPSSRFCGSSSSVVPPSSAIVTRFPARSTVICRPSCITNCSRPPWEPPRRG